MDWRDMASGMRGGGIESCAWVYRGSMLLVYFGDLEVAGIKRDLGEGGMKKEVGGGGMKRDLEEGSRREI